MNSLKNMMQQAQKIQQDMAQVQDQLKTLTIQGQSGGGLVRTTFNGKGEIQSLWIDPSLLQPEDKEVLEDLVIASFHDGKNKADQKAQEEMDKITGGLKLPENFKLPF